MVRNMTAALVAALLAMPLLASVRREKVEVDTTDSATVPAGGTLRLQGGLGDLNVETWDGPNIQIEVARFRYAADSAEKAAFEKDLKAISVSVKQEGSNAVVTTAFPHRSFWVKLIKGKTDAGIEYRVRVPRGTNIAVDHGDGAVVVADTGGDIDVTAEHGDIVALLSPDQYKIDARSQVGRVDSDYAGDYHHKRIIGEIYNAKADGAHHVHLRLKCGDITIQQALQFKYS